MKKVAVIGAGGWGTALAIALTRSRSPHRVCLWAREDEVVASLRERHVNEVFLSGCEVPAAVEVTQDLAEAVAGADFLLGVMPSAHARAMYAAMLPQVQPQTAIVSATKGLEPKSLLRMTEVIEQVCTGRFRPRVAALSGPSFAREVARGDPTAVVIASRDAQLSAEVQEEFSGPTFRLYTNDDVAGVELGGSVKNVIAIAAGVAEGLGFGHNTLAALITRGLAEMTRLALALGARRDTLAGLAGMGDLVLTCTGSLSRNRAVGVELGKGRPLAEITGAMRMVAEGVGTTAATHALAARLRIEMPITAQMYGVLYEGRSPRAAIRELMERPLKQE
ncbi:MAG TPA: NAD(P)H-dependent glycerol-3-phosphate dehydrogenase [Candidatus Acidoferrales bacterium]|jgi:glycerol-3-phosphate dehydrogenase (NAD(P)+)|nr:NAD(P)H-dependent glycerol-3-phosphate dehydrogenase [Candidatus Acidoferrales bacterium]